MLEEGGPLKLKGVGDKMLEVDLNYEPKAKEEGE